jgi:hypothetical protein
MKYIIHIAAQFFGDARFGQVGQVVEKTKTG